MGYVQITPPYGDINRLPAVQYKGHLEELQGVLRLVDGMLRELYQATSGIVGSLLVDSTPGSGSVTGYDPGMTIYIDRLDIAASVSDTTINDLPAGFDGQRLRVRNTGTGTLTLTDENSGSTAANRFSGIGDVSLLPGEKVDLIYYAGSVNRWTM